MVKRVFPLSALIFGITGIFILSQLGITSAQETGDSAPVGPRLDTAEDNGIRLSLEVLGGVDTIFRAGDSRLMGVRLDNLTNSEILDISAQIVIPPGLIIEDLDSDCEAIPETNNLLCTALSIPALDRTVFDFTVGVLDTWDEFGEEISASSANEKQSFAIDSALLSGVRTPGAGPLLGVIASATPNPVTRGGNSALSFLIKNRGFERMDDIRLDVQFPSSLTPSATSGCEVVTASKYSCPIAPLELDEMTNVAIPITVAADFPVDGATVRFGALNGATPTLNQALTIDAPTSIPISGCTDCTRRSFIWGDPHILQFDGIKYDFQVVGEFIYVDMPEPLGDIQVRTAPWSNSRRLSAVEKIAVAIGSNTVEVDSTGVLTIDSTPTEIAIGDTLDLGAGAGIYRQSAARVTLIWPGTDTRPELRIVSYGSFMNVDLRIPDNLAGQLKGLLGNADGITDNDFTNRDGIPLAARPTATLVHNTYAEIWRVSDAESLFTYEDGETTATFTDLTFPDSIARLSDLTPEQLAVAEAICRAFGVTDPILFEACVLDVGISDGNSAFAAASLDIDPPALGLDGVLSGELILGDNPLRFYRFSGAGDEALQDSAGSGEPITILNGGIQVPGPIANEPDFAVRNDGSSVDLARFSSTGLPTGSDDRTIEFWMNQNDLGLRPIATFGNFRIYHYGDTRRMSLRQDGQQIASWVTAEKMVGSWHHLALVVEDNNATLYVDGISRGTTVVDLDTQFDGDVDFGRSGAFDDIAIYDRALTRQEAHEHHAVGRSANGQPCRRGSTDVYGALILEDAPSAFFRFDDQNEDGTPLRIAIDSSPGCEAGTIISAATIAESPIGEQNTGLEMPPNSVQQVTIPPTNIPSGTEARAIEFWMRHDSARPVTLLTYGNVQFSQYDDASQLSVSQEGEGGLATWGNRGHPIEGTWHHLVYNYENGEIEAFLNGASLGKRPVPDFDSGAPESVIVGLLGGLDELAIYDRILTPEEITRHWSTGASGTLDGGCGAAPTDPYGAAVVADNPVSYFRLDELDAADPAPRIARDYGTICTPGAFFEASTVVASPVGPQNIAAGRDSGSGAVMSAPITGLPTGDSDRTIELWAQTNAGDQELVTWGGFEVQSWGFLPRVRVSQTSGSLSSWSYNLSGSFKHLVISIEAGQATLYVDGENVGTTSIATLTTTNEGELLLGQTGDFDELAIYDVALTEAQVQAHFAASN